MIEVPIYFVESRSCGGVGTVERDEYVCVIWVGGSGSGVCRVEAGALDRLDGH